MEGKARILIYGFSEEEAARIDAALGAVGVPGAARLRATQGQVVLSEIIEHDRDGTESFDSPEALVLFFNVSEAGIRTLIPCIRNLQVRRPIFAMVTETSYGWTLAQLLEHLAEERAAVEGRAARNRGALEGGGESRGAQVGGEPPPDEPAQPELEGS